MNICMFTNTYLPHVGGVAKSVDTFRADLELLGHRVLVIAPEYRTGEKKQPTERNVLRLPAIQKFNGSDFSVRIPVPFIVDERLDSFDPDVIHSHHPYLLGDTALRVAKTRWLPVVFTHHTLYEQYTHYVTSESETLKQFVINLSTEYANFCDRVIAPSRSVADLIRKRGVRQPIIEVPTGVDVQAYRQGNPIAFREKYGLPDSDLVIGHVGRLAPEKNIDFLGKAVADFLRSEKSAHFLVVGSGSAEQELQRWFQENSLRNRFVMTGKLTGQALADAYQAMDLFVFSSLSETQGMVLTEAMAAGKPVIALNASGVREVLQDQYNGCMLSADATAENFADAIRYAATNPAARDRWSENAKQTAERFDRRYCAERMLEVYQDAVVHRRQFEKSFPKSDYDLLDELFLRLRTEWELATQKFSALVQAVKETDAD